MAFRQLYYTSCQQGLSGFAGFQFNAITPGVDGGLMQAVERLTGYEPPISLPYRPTAEDLERCPVRLVHVPGEDTPGGDTLVAQVKYVGADFSGRSGNYFAHTLATTSPVADLGGSLPIELWRAGFWAAEESPSTELPELPALAGQRVGPLDRAAVAAFVAEQPPGVLAELLSAADLALAGGRSVVLVTADSDTAARWIAAVSYLAPPALARRLSFTTYHHRPSYCGLHLVGTVPDAAERLDADALDAFWLFDFVGGQRSEVGVHPAAALLDRVGIIATAELWARADEFAAGIEVSLDDWHPLAAVAAVLEGHPAGPADAGVAARWFGDVAAKLRAADAERLGGSLVDHPDIGVPDLRRLADGAAIAGLRALEEAAEVCLVNLVLDEIGDGGQVAAHEVGLRSAAAHDHARRQAAGLLEVDDGDVLAALLEWAAAARVDLDAGLLRDAGARTAGPLLETGGAGADRLRRAVAAAPAVLDGALGYLDRVAREDPDRVVPALAGDLATAERLRDYPALYEIGRLTRVPTDTGGRVRLLGDLLTHRTDRPGPVGPLLERIWPDGRWTAAEALAVLRALPHDQALHDPIPRWVDRALDAPVTEEALTSFLDLCEILAEHPHPLRERLPERRAEQLQAVLEVVAPLEQGAKARRQQEAGEAVLSVNRGLAKLPEPFREFVAEELLPDYLRKVSWSWEKLPEVLASSPTVTVEHYAERVRQELDRRRPDAQRVADLVRAVHKLATSGAKEQQHNPKHAELLIQRVFAPVFPRWRQRDKDALARHLEGDRKALEWFELWYVRQGISPRPEPGVSRVARHLMTKLGRRREE